MTYAQRWFTDPGETGIKTKKTDQRTSTGRLFPAAIPLAGGKNVFILFLLCLPTAIVAQPANIRFEHLSIEDGLSQNSITALLQDRRGFMWIGTQDGLNRFDGYRIKTWKSGVMPAPSLSGNHIQCLHEDRSGVLWIGTFSGGMTRFDPATETFKVYQPFPDDSLGLSDNRVYTIYEAPSDPGARLSLKRPIGPRAHFRPT